jgi:hypothetical protein
MELEIDPEPSEEEREAILAALAAAEEEPPQPLDPLTDGDDE